ncbi:MAG: hypothetical protein OXI58_07525 [Gemmatimonadota bacterium]|nr:hypothetical protein [Gemmatimonadota bacterium]
MNYRSLLIACLATLGLAIAGWGQADGKIAFTSWREGSGDVWIMNEDGSAPVNLTQGRHGKCVDLVWSPDGTKIAYLAFSDDPEPDSDGVIWVDYSVADIWVMDADGGNPQQVGSLTPGSEVLFWAEDGSSIYYYLRDPQQLFAVALDGSGSSPISRTDGTGIVRRFFDNFNLSPDGTKRATVVLQDDEGNAYLRLAGYAPIRLAGLAGYAPTEGPQPSDQIEDFREIPLPDLPYQQAELEPGWSRVAHSTWSPDSMRIAFYAANEQGYREVWVVDIDGSNLVNLTNGLGGDYPAWQPVVLSATATSVEAQSWGRIKRHLQDRVGN